MMEFAAYCTSGMGVQALPALALMDSSSLVQAYGGQLSGAAYTHPQQVPAYAVTAPVAAVGVTPQLDAIAGISQLAAAAPQLSLVSMALPVANDAFAVNNAAAVAALAAPMPQLQATLAPPARTLAMQPAAPQPATLFYAGVAPVANEQQLITLFSNYGQVLALNVFRPFNGSRTTKGCGLVVFSCHAEAAAAMAALHNRFVWPSARSPMVIEWMDPDKQHKKRRAQPLTDAQRRGLVKGGGSGQLQQQQQLLGRQPWQQQPQQQQQQQQPVLLGGVGQPFATPAAGDGGPLEPFWTDLLS